jgi:hypothetical protein
MSVGTGKQNIKIMFWKEQFHFWEYINGNQTFIWDFHRPFICSALNSSFQRVNCTLVEITNKMSCSFVPLIFPPLPPDRVHRQKCITIIFLTLDKDSPPAGPRFHSCPDQALLAILYFQSGLTKIYVQKICLFKSATWQRFYNSIKTLVDGSFKENELSRLN